MNHTITPELIIHYGQVQSENDRLRAELAEAQRQLKEASEQEPVGESTAHFDADIFCTLPVGTKLYTRAPVPQPAVPEAVAKDSDWKHVPVGRVIGDPVWAGQLWSTQIRGTKKLRHGDLVFIHPAAILSATDSEVKNGLR